MRVSRIPICLNESGLAWLSGSGCLDGQPVPVMDGLAKECVGAGFSVWKAMNGGEREAGGEWRVIEEAEGAANGSHS